MLYPIVCYYYPHPHGWRRTDGRRSSAIFVAVNSCHANKSGGGTGARRAPPCAASTPIYLRPRIAADRAAAAGSGAQVDFRSGRRAAFEGGGACLPTRRLISRRRRRRAPTLIIDDLRGGCRVSRRALP